MFWSDMDNQCQTCGRIFTRSDNLKRHFRIMHPAEQLASEVDESDNVTIESETEIDEQESDSDETKSSDESDAEEPDHWRDVIAESIRRFGSNYDDHKMLLHDPLLSEFIEEMRQVVQRRLEFADAIRDGDSLYSKIERRIEKYEGDDYSSEEAAETAWNDMRIVMRNLIRDNLDLFNEHNDNVDEEEEEEEEEDIISTS